MPYLEVNRDNETEETVRKEVVVPNVVGLTVSEAEKILKDAGLGIDLSTDEKIDKKQIIIKEQLPINGVKVYEGTNIYLTI